MPLLSNDIDNVHRYCDRDLPAMDWYLERFDFVGDKELREHIAKEFMAARYISKLGEALNVVDEKLHAHCKFQIVQYASIYEAVIVYLLWENYSDHKAVIEIEYHYAYKLAGSVPNNINITNNDGEEIFLCAKRNEKTSRHSIKFQDKVDASVKIGFLEKELAEEIKEFYSLRNALHLETAAKKSIKYELEQSRLAYLRMKPFVDKIKETEGVGTK